MALEVHRRVQVVERTLEGGLIVLQAHSEFLADRVRNSEVVG